MGHDNQQWRDLLGDLGSVCRCQCSEHCLLKAESTAPLLSISFLLQTYLYHCQHDYTSHCFMSSHLHSCVSMIDSSPSLHNHAYSYMSFPLTLIDITFLAALSLCIASWSLFLLFPFIFLLALKGLLPIYTGLLPLMYFNLNLYKYMCWSIFSHFKAPCFWKPPCSH